MNAPPSLYTLQQCLNAFDQAKRVIVPRPVLDLLMIFCWKPCIHPWLSARTTPMHFEYTLGSTREVEMVAQGPNSTNIVTTFIRRIQIIAGHVS